MQTMSKTFTNAGSRPNYQHSVHVIRHIAFLSPVYEPRFFEVQFSWVMSKYLKSEPTLQILKPSGSAGHLMPIAYCSLYTVINL